MYTFLRSFLLIGLVSITACSQATDQPQGQAQDQAPANPVTVILETSSGNITLELNQDKAPLTVMNFLEYVDAGFYNGTIFHRVIKDFMIQGGGFNNKYQKKKTNEPVVNEASNGLLNKRGTVSMARTNDPDSATAQFFINHRDNDFLNKSSRSAGYAVFGKVTDGLHVVDQIAMSKTGKGGPFSSDAPIEQVEIITIKRIK
ncbi:peptidyl-prolyl cis-trans isomerase [Solemya velum gill symbiont]|uniref:Peptidyl-prolyl cis-trans isomerase n=1 Tax=Solemya velum gill symbiont TaxID=2340 RepID=A0A0B0H9S9_SOVGS|nr:peptidylprolyl isomerase [Solemya velum gill symbiont]KHF24644.1 peptidyl-prolyl cis-trans isomerase [Solemya velum gill symbiont]